MNTNSLSFSHEQLNRLFPYFVLVKRNMKILDMGRELEKACPGCRNGILSTYFNLGKSYDGAWPPLGEEMTISLRSATGKIRGRWELLADDQYLFAGLDYNKNRNPEAFPFSNEENCIPTGYQAQGNYVPNMANFDRIIDKMGFGLIEIDSQGRIVYLNDRFSMMSGYEATAMLGKTAEFFFENAFFTAEEAEVEKADGGLQELVFTDAQGTQRLWLAGRAINYSKQGENTGWTGICFDVSEHKGFEQELINAKKDAERNAGVKAMFLANMSHEIRTPMNAIISMSAMLSKTQLNSEQEYYLQTVQTASKTLLVIIDDILDLSKIDAGKLNLENIGFSLSTVLGEVMQVVTHKAVRRGLEISYIPPTDKMLAPVLIGDPYRITQVVLNLMTNAIKFTEKGAVELTAIILEDSHDHQKIEVLVKDTGIGMEDEFLNHLFDNFSQEYESVTRRYGGTGLGMSISQKLVSQMGGHFKVKSAKGKGSEISFIITLEKGQLHDIPSETPLIQDEELFSGRRVLIVDDNEMNRLVASTILLRYGPQVMVADTGMIALDMLNDEVFDIVLMDIQMPELDGYDTTRALRSRGYTGAVIALTASAIEGEREKCLAAGMDDYITKPINEELLISTIDRWIKSSTTDLNPVQPSPTPAAETDLPLYSLEGLRVISKGREDFVTKMIQMFCEQIPDALEQLNSTFSSGDLEQLSKVAHKLKSTIDHLVIAPLQRTIREIEAAHEESPAAGELGQKVKAVNEVLREVLTALSEEITVRNPH